MQVRSGVSSPPPLMKVESGSVATPRYTPTPSLDAKNIELIKGVSPDNIGYIRCAIDAFGSIHSGLQKLGDAREAAKKNGAWTESNQILVVATEATKLMERATRSFDDARKRLTDGIKTLEDSLSQPLTAKADNSISAEIRAHFKSLPSDKRTEAINAAVKAKDMATLTAVLGGPSYLSALSEEEKAHHTRSYRELTTPDIVVRVDVMRKALDMVEKRSGLIFTEIEKALGASFSTVAKLRKASSAAEAALHLVNASPIQQ